MIPRTELTIRAPKWAQGRKIPRTAQSEGILGRPKISEESEARASEDLEIS